MGHHEGGSRVPAERLGGSPRGPHLGVRTRPEGHLLAAREPGDRAGRARRDRGHELEALEPRLWQFLLSFARDNDLQVTFVAGAMDESQSLVPPRPATSGEPREPV